MDTLTSEKHTVDIIDSVSAIGTPIHSADSATSPENVQDITVAFTVDTTVKDMPNHSGILPSLALPKKHKRKKRSYFTSSSSISKFTFSARNLFKLSRQRGIQSARMDLSEDDMYAKAEAGNSQEMRPTGRQQGRMQITPDTFQSREFLIKLAKALIRYGAPSYRLEAAMEKTSKKLDIVANFGFLPGAVIASFDDPESHTSETHIFKVFQGYELSKLSDVNDIANDVARGRLDVPDAMIRLDAIQLSPPTWGPFATVISYMISSAFVAPMAFNGSWVDSGVGAVMGLAVGLLTLLANEYQSYGNVFEVTTSIIVSFVARSLHEYICFTSVVLSAIVILLPGFMLTTAVMELGSRNIITGTVRMFYALMYALFLGFGLSVGSSLWTAIAGTVSSGQCATDGIHAPVNPWWFFLLFPPLTASVCIAFGARMRQWPPMMVIAAVAYVSSMYASKLLPNSSEISAVIASFAVGLSGNLLARFTGLMPIVCLTAGVILLVPGSIGVQGAFLLLSDNTDHGAAFAFQMILVALGITLGLFAASLVVWPRGRKHSVFLGF